MPVVLPVKFAFVTRDLWFDPKDTQAQEGDHVICETERGREMGLATSDAFEVEPDRLKATLGQAQLKPVLRIATEEDLDRAEALAAKGDEAMPVFRRLVEASGLDMKPVGVDYTFDGEKAVCYFAAEERVDFRQLVRDLSHELHLRIDMRQIGVREEAALVGGWGHCGQELCCRRFNTGFDPVSIRMAKEQDLPLNSTKISGACGRLMCCLRYEFEAYRDFKQRAPKKNAVIDTPLGKGKIVEYNTPRETIALRLENGKTVRVALADMTCSEAAHKKSEELGCPCRPDTVTREVLDRLESPDVQMALAELDRKNGVAPQIQPDSSDIFVDAAPRKRRRKAAAASEGADKGKQQDQPAEQSQGRRKRRRQEGAASAPAQQDQAKTQEAAKSSRRRRHHAAEGEQAAEQAQPQAERRGRRPGDKGGGMQPSRKRRRNDQADKPQAQQNQTQQQNQPPQSGDAPKPRRRRHHRGKGPAAGNENSES